MSRKKVLVISWQGGMGHITRDIPIADELLRQNPDVDLTWLASPLATTLLRETGHTLHPESSSVADYNDCAEAALDGYDFNLVQYMLKGRKAWAYNVELFRHLLTKERFDLIIGDEIYEIAMALPSKRLQLPCPVVMIHDFIGALNATTGLFDRCFVYLQNWKLARLSSIPMMTHLFVGEIEDVLDMPFGPLLPNRRRWANENCKCLGYIIRFNPSDYTDQDRIRRQLGYGPEPLVICALGGTRAGQELLGLCGRAYPILRAQLPGVHMVIVCGSRLSPESLNLPKDVDVRGYVPKLYEHYAACDLAVVVGGGTTTTELTALKRPFLYFPLEKQFDQQIYIPRRLARHKAGIRMAFHETSPKMLAEAMANNIGKPTDYATIPTDGAHTAGRLLNSMLTGVSSSPILAGV